ncbi:MAG: Gldg family protein [Candidatus Rifleibacteriota bacterium]
MKKLSVMFVCFLLLATCVQGAGKTVLYDDRHGQTAGNADWIPAGAYSEMVDMLKANGFEVEILSKVAADGKFTAELLEKYDALILAEPNNPYSEKEQKAFVDFVRNGGGAFLVGDHGDADRDNDGWDAVLALNTFCPKFGFKFNGDMLYEAPLSGKANADHPAMFGVRGVGAWAGSTFSIVEAEDAKAVGLIDSRFKKAPFVVAAEFGSGRVVAIGDSSPFDDGTGSGGHNKLHDSYDSFMYSHPQLAYNAMVWVCGSNPEKRIPSRKVAFFNEAMAENRSHNILIDAAHGNAASDKMETFERHMNKNGFKVFYTLNLIKPEMLENFGTLIIPDPSLRYIDPETNAISEWFNRGGNLIIGGSWDSSKLRGTETINFILKSLGSVMKLNDDQVWDNTNKTNKPWGVLAHVLKKGHPVTQGVKTVITWGTCSLIDRNDNPLTEAAGVEILITGDDDSFNKDGHTKYPAVIYPKGVPIPMMAIEKIVNGTLVLIGCCNFTDYQYPDSDINMAQPGPPPFEHETPAIYDNLMKYLTPRK